MKRPTLANENMVSLYAGRSYLSPSSKSPLQAYQKSMNLNFNSPKSETQKSFGFGPKAMGTNLRASAKMEKSEPILERKNSKNSNDNYMKNSSAVIAYGGGITRPNKPRGSSTKLSSSDKPSKNEQYVSKYSDTLNLRDSLLKQSRQKNLEINTDVQTYKTTGAIKAYSTKSKDLQVSSIGGNNDSYSGLDYTAKYFANQSAIHNSSSNKFDYSRTEGNDDKQGITPTTKQKSALGRILANTSEKGFSGSVRKPTPQNHSMDDDNYYKAPSQPTLKVNNFFSSSKRKELENSLQKRNDREEVGRSIDIGTKASNKSHLDYRQAYKGYVGMDDSKDDIRDVRNLSLTTPAKEPKSTGALQKNSLSSFITKVEKGSALPIRPPPKSNNEDDSPGVHARPYLTLEDKANMRAGRNASESLSSTTTNSESKPITFGKGRLTQQSLSSSQEVAKPKSKSFGLASQPNRDISRDQDEDVTPKRDAFTYYTTSLEKHHRNWNDSDYFCQIYKEHFIQSFQALTFCKYLRPVDPRMIAQKKVFLPKKPSHKGIVYSYNQFYLNFL